MRGAATFSGTTPDPAAPLHLATRQTPQTAGGSEFVPGELDAVGELEEGGEFDPDDLEEEGEAPVVEESAGVPGDGCIAHRSVCAETSRAKRSGREELRRYPRTARGRMEGRHSFDSKGRLKVLVVHVQACS